MTPHRGLLIPAYKWSTVMIFASGALWFMLGAVDVTLYSQESELLTRPLHNLIVGFMITLTIGSLAVRLAAAILTGQRRLMARLDALDADADAIVSAYAATLTTARTVTPMHTRAPLRIR